MSTDGKTVLTDQFRFLCEIDRLKTVLRKTSILDGSRKENSAEHSWHLILTAMTLAQHANEPIDMLKVVQMFALHDLGEIDAGDVLHYHKTNDTAATEETFVKTLFAQLPASQAEQFFAIWKEFEEGKTPEAKFAQALDRVWPFLQNMANDGGTWVEFNLSADQVLDRNSHIEDGSKSVWDYVATLINEAKERGYLTH